MLLAEAYMKSKRVKNYYTMPLQRQIRLGLGAEGINHQNRRCFRHMLPAKALDTSLQWSTSVYPCCLLLLVIPHLLS